MTSASASASASASNAPPSADAHAAEALPASLALGAVALRTGDPERLAAFYERVLGLSVGARSHDEITLAAAGTPIVTLLRQPDALPPPDNATGLFHFAMRVPDRAALAQRMYVLRDLGLRFGASDHLVSEALYLEDPDGNGIEIYRDRPPAEWPRTADGGIAMTTLRLNLSDLAGAAPDPRGPVPAPAGTDMGHVHLKVRDLAAAERFYVGLGFEVMARYPGAAFLAAGGYHHHIGLNVWHSAGGPIPASAMSGLAAFTLALPAEARDALRARAERQGVKVEEAGDALAIEDPSGNTVCFFAR